jgi:SAM-dependent methyltransferase
MGSWNHGGVTYPPPSPASDTPPGAGRATRWATERSLAQRKAYTRRFERIAAKGEDVHGEARFVDALAGRGSVILDAGCGTGRIAAELRLRGHDAVGVDADEVLIEAGRRQHPGLPLAGLDLTQLTPDALAAAGLPRSYDVIVAAGNVMLYVAPGTERSVLEHLTSVLRPSGRAIFGFQTDRPYTHEDLDRAAVAVGWVREHRFGTWQCDPYDPTGGWATSVYRPG